MVPPSTFRVCRPYEMVMLPMYLAVAHVPKQGCLEAGILDNIRVSQMSCYFIQTAMHSTKSQKRAALEPVPHRREFLLKAGLVRIFQFFPT